MSREHHGPPERAAGSGTGAGSEAVWDTGSSLYDSYELAAVRRLIAVAGAGVLPLHDEPPSAAETRDKNKNKQVVAVGGRARRKVTLRALFRAVATWAARPRQAPSPLACACAGMVLHDQSGAAVEPDVPSHGQL